MAEKVNPSSVAPKMAPVVDIVLSNHVQKELLKVTNLPTLPVILKKLGTEIRNPNSDARKVARIMEDDPAMMVRILKVVNSAFYAGSEPVKSMQFAVARIGMRAVENIAMSTAVFSAFGQATDAEFNRQEFWRHSICTGIAANVLYEQARGMMPARLTKDVLHLAGLIHDIGKIVFDQYFHDEFIASLKMGQEAGLPILQAEKSVLGDGHDQVGAWLGRKWNLSDDLYQVIRYHHEPERCPDPHQALVGLIHAANYICNSQNIGISGDYAPSFVPNVWKKIGLKTEDIPVVIEKVNAEAKKSELLMMIGG